jgi:hypothetical protein
MGNWLKMLGLCLGPLAVTPLLVLLIAEGYLNFGGGEKDLILVLPWVLWSLVYGSAFAVCWARKLPLRRALSYAAGGATILVVVAWVGLLVWTLI